MSIIVEHGENIRIFLEPSSKIGATDLFSGENYAYARPNSQGQRSVVVAGHHFADAPERRRLAQRGAFRFIARDKVYVQVHVLVHEDEVAHVVRLPGTVDRVDHCRQSSQKAIEHHLLGLHGQSMSVSSSRRMTTSGRARSGRSPVSDTDGHALDEGRLRLLELLVHRVYLADAAKAALHVEADLERLLHGEAALEDRGRDDRADVSGKPLLRSWRPGLSGHLTIRHYVAVTINDYVRKSRLNTVGTYRHVKSNRRITFYEKNFTEKWKRLYIS